MKPKIEKGTGERHYCTVPTSQEPKEGAPDRDWEIYAASGHGSSPKEAYEEWLKDCEWMNV